MRRLILVSTTVALAMGLTVASLDAQQPGPPRNGSERPGRQPGETPRGPRQGGPDVNPRLQGLDLAGTGLLLPGVHVGRLELTADQRSKLRDVLDEVRTKITPVRDELRKAEAHLRAALLAETRNDAGVREAATRVAQLRQQMTDIRITASASVTDLLTPEQRERLRSAPERPAGSRNQRGEGRRLMRRPAPVSGD